MNFEADIQFRVESVAKNRAQVTRVMRIVPLSNLFSRRLADRRWHCASPSRHVIRYIGRDSTLYGITRQRQHAASSYIQRFDLDCMQTARDIGLIVIRRDCSRLL